MLEELGGLEIPDESREQEEETGYKDGKDNLNICTFDNGANLVEMLENASNILCGCWSGFDNAKKEESYKRANEDESERE